jgi:hypothetical protein
LTGGLLQVAGTQYFAKLRSQLAELDSMNRVSSPISGFVGVVSATQNVEYLDGTAFSIQPSGLLIDMRGLVSNGNFRINQAAQFASKHVDLAGYIFSSLEHEVWQELTGYDAISTVRGLQFAFAQYSNEVTAALSQSTNTLPVSYSQFQFRNAPPPEFVPISYTITSETFKTWKYTGADPANAAFEAMRPSVVGLRDTDLGASVQRFSVVSNLEPLLEFISQTETRLRAAQATVGQLKRDVPVTVEDAEFANSVATDFRLTDGAGFESALNSDTGVGSTTAIFKFNETFYHPDGAYPIKFAYDIINQSNYIARSGVPYSSISGSVFASSSGDVRLVGTFADIFEVVSARGEDVGVFIPNPPPIVPQPPLKYTLSIQLRLKAGRSLPPSRGPHVVQFDLYSYGFKVGYSAVEFDVYNGTQIGNPKYYQARIDVSDAAHFDCPGTGAGGASQPFDGLPGDLINNNLKSCLNTIINRSGLRNSVDFFNSSPTLIYRSYPDVTNSHDASFIAEIRNDLELRDLSKSRVEFFMASQKSKAGTGTYGVAIRKQYVMPSNALSQLTMRIDVAQGPAGGGYTIPDTLTTLFGSIEIPSVPSLRPAFSNASFTDLGTVSFANNDWWRTPSTTDPVSTVTGNNFHDETDLVIKGRKGLNYVFTRTYN